MNILNQVTLKSLRKNKTRTIVTIIGIILSTAMICAVTTFAASVRQSMIAYAEYESGRWYGMTGGISAEEKTRVLSLDGVSETGVSQDLGYAAVDGIENEYKPYLRVLGGDDGFFRLAPVNLIAGRLPENENEILIPEHLSANGGLTLKEGDKLTLSLGERVISETGEVCGSSPLRKGVLEEIDVRQTREYTVVGSYRRFPFELEGYSNPGYTAITRMGGEASPEALYDVYFRTGKPKDIYSFIQQNNLVNTQKNSYYLMCLGVSGYGSFYAMLYSLLGIVVFIIILGSVSLIYNAFSISVSERTKQFGLLSSIGATKKQLRSMVFAEAMALSAVGIPIGVVSGIAGIGVTLYFLKDTVSLMMDTAGISLSLAVSWVSVAAAVVIALLTVLISAWIPSRRAQKVTAIEAIRQSSDIKASAKDVKVSPMTYKCFGLEGLLAKKHFKRSRKKYRATVLSLALSVILFLSAASFSRELVSGAEVGMSEYNYDVQYFFGSQEEHSGNPEPLFSQLKTADGVTGAAFLAEYTMTSRVRTEALSEEYKALLSGQYAQQKEHYESQGRIPESFQNPLDEEWQLLYPMLCFVDDDSYRQCLEENKINPEKATLPDGGAKPLLFTRFTRFDSLQGKYLNYSMLDSKAYDVLEGYVANRIPEEEHTYLADVELDGDGHIIGGKYERYQDSPDKEQENEPPETFVRSDGKILSFSDAVLCEEFPFFLSEKQDAAAYLIYPMSARETVLSDSNAAYTGNMCFLSSDSEKTCTAMEKILNENRMATSGLYDWAKEERSARALLTFIHVFSYGFIILISLISAANVFNTITTNLNLRRREFAMLKTVGMTRKGFRKMMNFECLLYGVKSLLYGLPPALLISYGIYQSVSFGVEHPFSPPWSAIGTSVLCVFLVVFASMLFSMSKINKDNPIDALRNENL